MPCPDLTPARLSLHPIPTLLLSISVLPLNLYLLSPYIHSPLLVSTLLTPPASIAIFPSNH